MEAFNLDTSGAVSLPVPLNYVGALQDSLIRWSDLTPFQQGYVEAAALNQSWVFAFSSLAPETLAAILRDCEAFQEATRGLLGVGQSDALAGRAFWEARQAGRVGGFPPLTPYLGDDGRVYLREGV